jgi:hypothetical protein
LIITNRTMPNRPIDAPKTTNIRAVVDSMS